MTRPVSIVTGSGQGLGTGHLTRMRVLEHQLAARGLVVRFFADGATDTPASQAARTALSPAVVVLDARDADPRPLRGNGPVLALDNRHGSRATATDPGLIYYDTIPHPQIELDAVLERALIAPELTRLKRRPLAARGQNILVYCPDVAPRGLMDFLAHHRQRFPAARIVIVGGGLAAGASTGPPVAGLTRRERLESTEFFSELQNARLVLAYFGMTILEAWYAGAVPVQFSIDSSVHDRLSEDLERRAGILFVKEPAEFAALSDRSAGLTVPLGGPGGRGYELLVREIENLTGSP